MSYAFEFKKRIYFDKNNMIHLLRRFKIKKKIYISLYIKIKYQPLRDFLIVEHV